MLGVLLFDTLPSLVIGVVVSILLLLYRTARPNVALLFTIAGGDQFGDLERAARTRPLPGIVIARPESALFFANSDHVRTAIMAHVDASTRAVILDAETVPMIDVTAATTIIEMFEDLRDRGIRLVVARDIGQLRDLLRVDAAKRGVELPPLYPTVRAAVEAIAAGPR